MQLIQSAGYACIPLGLLYTVWPDLMPGRGIVLIGITLALPAIAVCRVAIASGVLEQKVLFWGAGEWAHSVAAALASREDLRVTVAGYLTGGEPSGAPPKGGRILGRVEELIPTVRSTQVDRI